MERKQKFEVPERHRPEQLAQQQPEQLDAIKAQLSEISKKLDAILKNTEG